MKQNMVALKSAGNGGGRCGGWPETIIMNLEPGCPGTKVNVRRQCLTLLVVPCAAFFLFSV